jgi:hypothetical protein
MKLRLMKQLSVRAALVVVGSLAALLVCEVAVRASAGRLLDWGNRVRAYQLRRNVLLRQPTVYDETLGWIPTPGGRRYDSTRGARVTLGEDGVRLHSPPESGADSFTILAVGDSFTFGQGVGDEDTWPAQLQALIGRRVINAGVFGYGLDQSVLRAERLVEGLRIDLLIVGFIADDVNRCGLSIRTQIAKPYFKIDENRLVLQNVPVPKSSSHQDLDPFRAVFGYSELAHRLMMRSQPLYWLAGESVRADNDPEKVACLLTERLRDLGNAKGFSILLLAQPAIYAPSGGEKRKVRRVLSCARKNGLATLNLLPLIEDYRRAHSRSEAESLFRVHMTRAGNEWVARQLARHLPAVAPGLRAGRATSSPRRVDGSRDFARTSLSRTAPRACRGRRSTRCGGDRAPLRRRIARASRSSGCLHRRLGTPRSPAIPARAWCATPK